MGAKQPEADIQGTSSSGINVHVMWRAEYDFGRWACTSLRQEDDEHHNKPATQNQSKGVHGTVAGTQFFKFGSDKVLDFTIGRGSGASRVSSDLVVLLPP